MHDTAMRCLVCVLWSATSRGNGMGEGDLGVSGSAVFPGAGLSWDYTCLRFVD